MATKKAAKASKATKKTAVKKAAEATGGNSAISRAKAVKLDEFYTQIEDIERELAFYKKHFKGKTVLCNCDDPRVSNFFHYFAFKFESLGLKKLITTCYRNNKADLFSENTDDEAVYLVYEGDKNGSGVPEPDEIGIHPLKEDGDFRSAECIELLKEADIIVTNPPFSLFKEFIPLLMKHKKKFLVVGNQNATTYKEIFPFIMDGKMWWGYHNGDMEFRVPSDYEPKKTRYRQDATGQKWQSLGNACWYTNLDFQRRHEDLILYETYSPEKYPKFDNYDAINVNDYRKIPKDYKGVMGVPLGIFSRFNPEQFELVGHVGSYAPDGYSLSGGVYLNGKKKFKRILIRNKRL